MSVDELRAGIASEDGSSTIADLANFATGGATLLIAEEDELASGVRYRVRLGPDPREKARSFGPKKINDPERMGARPPQPVEPGFSGTTDRPHAGQRAVASCVVE